MNKKNFRPAGGLRPWLGAAAFCLLAVLLAVIWKTTRPETVSGEKHITVTVVHSHNTTATYTYDTDEEYLGPLLVSEGLISGTEGPYGLYVDTVDRETADYGANGSWWKLSRNGEDPQVGVDEVVIYDGDQYTWTYTVS